MTGNIDGLLQDEKLKKGPKDEQEDDDAGNSESSLKNLKRH